MKIAQFQTHVYKEKEKNIGQLAEYMERIKGENVDFVAFPEMFNCPYVTVNFPQYAEPEGGPSWQACRELARQYEVYLSAGTMPEMDQRGRVYNTAYVFDRQGRQIARHRKVYLFDVEIEGGQHFKESETITAGENYTVFDTEFGKMGLCICFDLRFPELCRVMAEEGVEGRIFVPAAFRRGHRTGTLGTSVPQPGCGQPVLYGGDIIRKRREGRFCGMGASFSRLPVGRDRQ